MNQSKTTYLILFLIFLLFVLVVVQIVKTPKDQVTITPSEENLSENTEPPAKQNDFKVISFSPKDEPIGVTEAIKIRFSKPVTLESVIYEVNPEEQIVMSLDSSETEVALEHIQAWGFDTNYTIKILKSTISKDFIKLDKDYTFTFNTASYSGI